MNIKDKLQEIEERSWDYDFPYVGEPLKKELLDLWMYLHQHEKPEPILQIKLLHPDAKVPTRGSDGAIGWDLHMGQVVRSPFILLPHETRKVHTGISVAIPHGYYGRIAPRSGLAAKQGINILAGVIDEDYRGEILVLLHNTSNISVSIDQTKPIAQLILERADQGRLIVVDELDDTVRGDGGFGSTDTKKGDV